MTKLEKHLAIYQAYPKKKARATALKAIEKALKTVSFKKLLAKTEAYAKHVEKLRGTEQWKYVPHPATWFNGECWDDDFNFEPFELRKEDTTRWGQQSDVNEPTDRYGQTKSSRVALIANVRKANPSLRGLSDDVVYERWLLANGYRLKD